MSLNFNNQYLDGQQMTNKVLAAHSKVTSSLFVTSATGLRAPIVAPRTDKNTVRMSHFTSLKTQIKDPEMLKKTLQ